MNLRFAFAVDKNGDFQDKHFGDADKYIVFEHDSKNLVFIDEINNINRDIDEETKHGSEKKGNAVINYLKKINVNILVSRQFGQNLKMINKHFVPVLIADENIENTIKFLEKNTSEINEEVKQKKTNYNIFRFANGVFK